MGQRVLLYNALELGRWWREQGLFLFYQHASNGPMGGANHGLNNLGVRYAWRF